MKTNDRYVWHLAMGFLALALGLYASGAQADGIIDGIVKSAENASGGWMDKALGYAQNLFFGLAALEFVWAGTQLLLQKNEMSEVAVGLLMKVVTIGFFGLIITKAPEWFPLIMSSFREAGQGISGTPSLSPSGVLDDGINVAATMVDKGMGLNGGVMDAAFGDGLGKWLLSAVIIGFSGLIIIIAYAFVAIQLAMTLIESAIIIGGGVLMLGFTGSRWTMNFGERVFGYMMSNGAKLLTIYLIIGFGHDFTQAAVQHIGEIATANGGHLGFSDFLGLAGGSAVYGALGYLVPGLAGSLLNGQPSLSMSNVGQAAKGAASMPISAGMSTAASGARMMGGGAAGAAWLGSKFGGASGSIGGVPPGGGGGGGGGIFGSGKPGSSGKPGDNGKPGSGGKPGDMHSQIKDDASRVDKAATKGDDVVAAGDKRNHGDAGGGGGAPGFQSPRSMDSGDGGGGGGSSGNSGDSKGKMSKFAESMNRFSRDTQSASDRQKQGMGHDGNAGAAPSIRLNI